MEPEHYHHHHQQQQQTTIDDEEDHHSITYKEESEDEIETNIESPPTPKTPILAPDLHSEDEKEKGNSPSQSPPPQQPSPPSSSSYSSTSSPQLQSPPPQNQPASFSPTTEQTHQLQKSKSCISSFKETNENTSTTASSSPPSPLDPRYIFCEYCKSKHTKKAWGEYKRVTEEISRFAADKSVYRLRLGMWICQKAYEILTDSINQQKQQQQQVYLSSSTATRQGVPAQDDLQGSSSLVTGNFTLGSDALAASKRFAMTQLGEPEKKMFKSSLDRATELKRKAESLLLTQKQLNANIKGMLLELNQHTNATLAQPATNTPIKATTTGKQTQNMEMACADDGADDKGSYVDMKKLGDILEKIENAQSSLIKTRSGGVFGKFSNDVFTELAGLKYNIIEFKNTLSEK